eukprot:COSAG04_NODE_1168_length_7978_cov_4.222998_10_plen_65_part_00
MRNPNYTYVDTMKPTLDDEGPRKSTVQTSGWWVGGWRVASACYLAPALPAAPQVPRGHAYAVLP